MAEVTLAQGNRDWRPLGALSLTMLLPSLGTSIANVALPTLAVSFEATMAEVQWVVIAYLLAVTSLIVGVGRLGDIMGRRRLLLLGIALFAAASAVSALSPGLWLLIAARAVQGLGAAIMMALTVAMVSDLAPKNRTGSAVGMLGTVSAVGTALGPSLGGVLIAAFGWPAVFALLAATGLIALLVGRTLFPAEEIGALRSTRLDGAGMVLLALSLLAFSAMFILAGRMPVPAVATLASLSALALSAFVRHEARAPAPLIQMDLLRERPLAAGLLSMTLVSAILMATLVVGPFYLSGPLGLGAVETGLVMSIGPTTAALTGAPAGRLVDRLGSFRVIVAGLVAVAAGSVLLAVLPGWIDVAGYAGSLVVVTAGYALFQAANTTAVMQDAVGERRGVTSALLGLSRNLGLITGASAMGAIYATAPHIAGCFGLRLEDEAGLQVTFAVAAGLAGLALGATLWSQRRRTAPSAKVSSPGSSRPAAAAPCASGAGCQEVPQLLLRIGRGPEIRPAARRSVDEVMMAEDDASG